MCIQRKARFFLIYMIFIIFTESKFQKVSKEESIFNGWSEDDFKRILLQAPPPKPRFYNDSQYLDSKVLLPQSFDCRMNWPKCTFKIKDQGKCGSGWSFSSSEMLGDRFCIFNHTDIQLSAQYVVSCNSKNDGCTGETIGQSYFYLLLTGIVTESCFPYTSGTDAKVPKCRKSCALHEPFLKYSCLEGSLSYFQYVAPIQQEILSNGPVTAGMIVYEDFKYYKSGIYENQSSNFIGYHFVKIIGWGFDAEKSKYYWTAANSWGPNWGMNGFFNIYTDQCNISSSVASCHPGNTYIPSPPSHIILYIVLGIIIICVAIGVFFLVRYLKQKKNRELAGYTAAQTLMNN